MTQIADTALAPCPFCGSPASLEHDSDHHGKWFNLGCSKHWEAVGDDEPSCPAGRMWYTAGPDEEAGAIETWNRRSALIPSRAVEPVAWLGGDNERICDATAMRQWEASLKRPDLAEKDRVRGAVEAFKRQAIAVQMLVIPPQAVAPTGEIERNTHLIDWLNDGHTHCLHGTKEWCEGYLHNARDVIKAQDASLTALSAKLADAKQKCRDLDKEACDGRVIIGRLKTQMLEAATVLNKTTDRAEASEAESTDLRRKLEEAERDRDGWRNIVGTIVAQIPLPQVLSTTGTTGDLIAYLKGILARAESAERKLEEARECFAEIEATGKAADNYSGDRLSPEEVYMGAVSEMRSACRAWVRTLTSGGDNA